MPKLNVDKALIAELAKLLESSNLSEISWSEAGVEVRVARNLSPPPMLAPTPMPAASVPVAPASAAPAGDDELARHPGAVKSPMVGTAYRAPEPDAAPFVQVGDIVNQGQTVLIVEAMKTMNPIPAPKAGKVKQILVTDREPVEYGQVLVIIE